MKYIISIDVGTTSIKIGLFDKQLKAVGFLGEEYTLLMPQNEYVELDADIYWQSIKKVIKKLLKQYGVDGQDIASIGICSQGETVIPVDKNGNPLHNAIVWLDARAKEEAELLKHKIGEDLFYRTTGLNEIWAAHPICKLLWIKNNLPQVYNETDKFLLLTDFITYQLCGKALTEWTMMCSTGYYDINQKRVWFEGLRAAGIDLEKIPPVHKSGISAGTVSPDVANSLGISADTKVIISANDQMCGAVGGGNISPGIVTETTGTALVLTASVDKPNYDSAQKLVYYLHVKGNYLSVLYSTTAGMILKWFKDEFCEKEVREARELGVSIYDMLGRMAAAIAPGSEGLMLYPQFAGKVSPNNDPYTRGVFFNVGLNSKKAHFIRAIFEGVAYMLCENIKAIEESGIIVSEIKSMGGGSKSDIWNQIKADVTGKTIVTLEHTETTSLGVAIIAAVSLNWFESIEEAVRDTVLVDKVFHPNAENAQKYMKAYAVYTQLDKGFAEFFYQLNDKNSN